MKTSVLAACRHIREGRPGRTPLMRDQKAPRSCGLSAPVTLFRRIGGTEASRACLRFYRHVDEPKFRLSGWSCLGDDMPARRVAIGCMLNRLILLTAGNDAKLTELFARAELRRSECAPAALTLSADWLTGADDPRLRGAQ